MAKQPRFVVHDNKEICLSLCPITKKCRSLGGERQFFFFLYLIYMYGTSWLQVSVDNEFRDAIFDIASSERSMVYPISVMRL